LSQRYFYESFANIDELLVAVFDHVMESTITCAMAELPQAGGDIRMMIAALANAFAATLGDERATRVALIEAWGSEALMRRRVATLHAGAISLADAVKKAARHAPNDGSVELAAFAIVGGLLESMLAWVDGEFDMARDTLFERFIDISVATMEQALRGSTAD
jgi:AcrR family transcriptional regulator